VVGRPTSLIAVAILVAACGIPPATPALPSANPLPRTSLLPATAEPPVESAAASTATVPIDPALRTVLPPAVDGLPVQPAPEADAVAAADPVVIANAEAVVTALAIDPAGADFAFATVVRLKPGAFDEGLFRTWRDSFDAGACSQAAGVRGHAEADIGGRHAYLGTCVGGLRTYHVWLSDPRLLVSVSGLGERRLGEQLIADIRE